MEGYRWQEHHMQKPTGSLDQSSTFHHNATTPTISSDPILEIMEEPSIFQHLMQQVLKMYL